MLQLLQKIIDKSTQNTYFYYDLEDIKALDGADFIEMLKK